MMVKISLAMPIIEHTQFATDDDDDDDVCGCICYCNRGTVSVPLYSRSPRECVQYFVQCFELGEC